ncbi:unnamed protein product [Mytilus coruscus]|uniref:Uncharacterized protein n=1 Tax=Mytilus coruscus TaxID=42192 RepID=A0A6J8ERM9_MYTCO|nr:unnamed protein product [Mytilus coruscus]
MEDGCMCLVFSLFAAFIVLGGVLISHRWTNVIKDDNTDNSVDMGNMRHSVDMDNMRQELQQCKASMTQIKQDFISLQVNFTQIQEKIENFTKVMNGSIKNARDDFLHLKRDMKILNGMQDIHDHRYITYSETVFLLLVVLILERLIPFLFYKFLPWRNGFYGSQGSNHDGTHDTHDSPCAQAPVENVSVAFNEETQDLHHRIITSAFQQEEIEIKPFLLEKADRDVLKIPTCQFIFVFVDFNETNVILENPVDKRLVTVQACMKMGADVFVIYTRDRDSNDLEDGKLYNKNLSSFTGHPLLKDLTAKSRGLSVNDTFTPYQKSHVKGVVLKK